MKNPDHQTDALPRDGVAVGDVYLDHAAGAKASRPELDALLRALRSGDTLWSPASAAQCCTWCSSARTSATAG